MSDNAMESAKHALAEGWRRANEALKNADVEAMLALFTDDAILIDPAMATAVGKENLRKTYQAAFSSTRFLDMTHEQTSLAVQGGYAVESGVFTQTTQDKSGGPPGTTMSRYLMVWQKIGDDWLVLRDAAIPFPAGPDVE